MRVALRSECVWWGGHRWVHHVAAVGMRAASYGPHLVTHAGRRAEFAVPRGRHSVLRVSAMEILAALFRPDTSGRVMMG
jgi:hypothetical protein